MVKKFVIHTIYFSISLGLIFLLFEVLLRCIPNNYQVKDNSIEKNASKAEVLVVGNSHAFHGINPDYIKLNTLNLANGSQSIKYDKFLFEKALAKAPNLKYLIITLSYPSMSYELEGSIESWRIKNYVIYHDFKEYPYTIKYHSEVLNGQLYVPLTSIFDYYVRGKDLVGCKENGFFNRKLPQADLDETGKRIVFDHTHYDEHAWKANTQNLIGMLNLAKSKNIKVLMVTLPTWKSYYSGLDSLQVRRNHLLCDSLVHAYPNLKYVDDIKNTDFLKSDFFDADHLNTDGAKKYSVKLDSLIELWH